MKNKTCPKGYEQFLHCMQQEPPFESDYWHGLYCSDETCPYTHHKPRRKVKKENPDLIRSHTTIVTFRIDNGPNTEVKYKGFVSEKQIQKDYEEWLDRYIYSTPHYDQRGEVIPEETK